MADLLFSKELANVGLFCDCFPPVMDGVSVCVENYAEWMQKMAGGVKVITPTVPGVDYSHLDYEVISYHSMPVPKRHPYVTGVPEIDPAFLHRISKVGFKILHAHCPFPSGHAALMLKKLTGAPLVATFHSKYRDDFVRVMPDKAADLAVKIIMDFYAQADLVWVPQQSVIDVIRDYGFKGEVEVMDNGSDLVADYPESYFEDARKALGIAPDEFVILFVGQHIWEKNTRLIIDSLSRLADCPFRMYFVGTGYAREEMMQLVHSYGLDPKVTFVGPLTDREAIRQYYAAANLFLFPSLYDNAPLVVREAAALHTPAVMARGATASTIIDDGRNGFLVEPDADSMAALLRNLCADPQRVRDAGLEASKTIVRSWKDCVSEALDRYNLLLKSKGLPEIERI